MADLDDSSDATTFATVTQLFRQLSKPAAPISELLRDLTPFLLQRYSQDHPALTSHQCARQLLTDLTHHTDWVKAAVFSRDGALLATTGDDRVSKDMAMKFTGPVSPPTVGRWRR